MPAHESILSPEEIRVVAAYVYGLSHGARPAHEREDEDEHEGEHHDDDRSSNASSVPSSSP
jgi:hypothetical protein